MMTSTPPAKLVDILGAGVAESWVQLDVSSTSTTVPQQLPAIGERGTPTPLMAPSPLCADAEYLRLLREAQRESNQSSARVSIASSRKGSPRGSPKSPPNSPNNELSSDEDQLHSRYYINQELEEAKSTDWVWDWSSRPDQTPPKEWKFRHPTPPLVRRSYSIRHAKVGKTSLFSREVLYTLVLTNVISFLLGTGIGVWICKRAPAIEGGLTILPLSVD
ncbi:BCL2/adenovirus E1B 19 kDa protein-interacting protein 3 isoform X1 [Neocloeon triangulifer]|uniref:BCL2/adenovirus E1B 19 kDa protein-interacting protein 3 isoform X1 n=1 Tax=Neocloeon triangulifer TaxID=2078957 RepID=UPI00286ED5A5|nr:BCL2/adenovirus E1B 19 kDa protein-interacting protein 3 isoform X1 [Neocloeon triangulifer]